MPIIEPHFCNVCKRRNQTVYAFTLKDGSLFQMCKECMATVIADCLEQFTDDIVKKHLENS